MSRILAPMVVLLAVACSSSPSTPDLARPNRAPTPRASSADASRQAADASAPSSDAIPAPDSGGHRDESEHESLPSRVRLSDRVIRAAGIRVAPVALLALPSTVNLTGELISDPDRTAKVTARVPGRILDVAFKEGDRVRAGALLATIESADLARARAALSAAQARSQAAHQNLERLRRVAASGLASGQELAVAEADSATVDAELRAARQTLSAFGAAAGPSDGAAAADGARLALRAPVAGFILARDAVRGQTVTADHVAFVIADLDRAYFTARLFEKDLARVRTGAAAEVRLNAYPAEVFVGTVESVGRALDPVARTVLARIAVHNRNDLLKVGLFGTAHVVVTDGGARTPRPVVPLSAVTQIAGSDCVFVREPDGDFELHRVTLGRSAGGRVEVVAGLRAGEQVVVDGVFTLKSAVLKRTFGEED
jgi:cobalt-zinc-cadmium efflux system membrane fusion protein